MPPSDRNRMSLQAAEDEPAAAADRPGVLVIDDDRLVRIMVQLGLERNGFEVWTASGGREAVDLYRDHLGRIAVVLLDVRMPEMDGPQTLEALRRLNPEIRACFMSGNTGAYEEQALRRRGAAHVIAKPFLMDQLAEILHDVARGAPAELGSKKTVARGS